MYNPVNMAWSVQMKEKVESPIYSQIALDIAFRISKGEIKEGTRLSGRSVLASEYKVSPETIRRSLRILEDMAIVKVFPGSGVEISSRAAAAGFIEHYNV